MDHFKNCTKKLAFEESFSYGNSKKHKENNTMPKKRSEKLKNVGDTKKPDSSLLEAKRGFKKAYNYSGSSFKSEAEIIASIIKAQTAYREPSEVIFLKPDDSMVIPEMTIAQKACILARKYKKQHFILNKLSRMNHKRLSPRQIELIFSIARQCKQAAE